MGLFRSFTPVRRPITKAVSHYREHREDLMTDYQNRCGYCDDINIWRTVWFEIDHLVPQKYLVTIKDTDYSNLVYACRSCNNAKRANWPTQKENIHNENDEGFIDPCNEDYNKQFSRQDNGRIKAESNLGEWMYNKMKLYKPQHEIIWNIEQLDILIGECEAFLAIMPNDH
ncbi:HNH endonuclease [Chryseobacterium sp. CH1]|nr:HNH endonuclease signature motif containing protein [Chryseobacterium sp. CH1]RXM63086.1 HNH endonuclease [Chryseobacterium sp. CH1]